MPVYDCGCGLKVYRRSLTAGVQLPRGMNRFLPALLGVDPARVVEVTVNDRQRGSGRSHYGLSRTFVVLRDLLALPLLVRRRRGSRPAVRAVGGAQTGLFALTVVAMVGALGWPAEFVPALVVALVAVVAAALGWAVRYNLERWEQAQQDGVFRVRRVG